MDHTQKRLKPAWIKALQRFGSDKLYMLYISGFVVHPRMDMWISCKTPTYPHTHTPTDALRLPNSLFINNAMKPGQPQSGCSPDKQMGLGASQWF